MKIIGLIDKDANIIKLGKTKLFLRRLQVNPKHAKVFQWGKLLTITGGGQAFVQGFGLLCGILVIRLLPTQEYAWYTLANTMLGTMTLLADGGISIGVMSEGSKVWENKEKLGIVLKTGLDLRKKFALVSLIVITPVLVYLLMSHGANWLTTALIILSLIPAFLAALSDSLLEIVPKLHQDISSLQKNQITVSIGRLLLSFLMLFLFPFTFIAILAGGIPRVYGNLGLRKIASNFTIKSNKSSEEVKTNILKVVKRILPGAIYYCLSGQITIWLISIFGNSSSIAQAGALGRLAMVLSVVSSVLGVMVIPRFARLPAGKNLLLKRFIQIEGILIFLCLGIVFITWAFPTQILWILGNKYMGLQSELVLCVIGSCLGMIWGNIFNLYSSRGWILHPVLSVSVNLVTITTGAFLIDISTLKGVLLLGIFVAVIELLLHTIFSLHKILNLE